MESWYEQQTTNYILQREDWLPLDTFVGTRSNNDGFMVADTITENALSLQHARVPTAAGFFYN